VLHYVFHGSMWLVIGRVGRPLKLAVVVAQDARSVVISQASAHQHVTRRCHFTGGEYLMTGRRDVWDIGQANVTLHDITQRDRRR
jgi:hypothetical protein